MSAICARLGNKGKVGVQRGRETAGVPSFLPPRRAPQSPALRRAQLPAEVQRKTPRPLGANPPAQFACPAQPVLRKGCRPSGANTPAAVRVPRSAGAEKAAAPSGANPSPLWFSAAKQKHRRPQSAVFCFIPFRQGRKTRQAARYCPRYTQSRASTPCRCRSAPSA